MFSYKKQNLRTKISVMAGPVGIVDTAVNTVWSLWKSRQNSKKEREKKKKENEKKKEKKKAA